MFAAALSAFTLLLYSVRYSPVVPYIITVYFIVFSPFILPAGRVVSLSECIISSLHILVKCFCIIDSKLFVIVYVLPLFSNSMRTTGGGYAPIGWGTVAPESTEKIKKKKDYINLLTYT